jgi:hypothetical protein
LQAIGTSLRTADEVAGKVKGCDLTAVKSVAALEGEAGQKGRGLCDELFEAFRRNEYAVPFGPKLDAINQAAVKLLSSLVSMPFNRESEPTALVAEEADLISKWGRSQVGGDDVPAWVPAGAKKKLLVVVSIRDVHSGGTISHIVVTKNLAALLGGSEDAEIDSDKAEFRIPRYGIHRPLSTDPDQGN